MSNSKPQRPGRVPSGDGSLGEIPTMALDCRDGVAWLTLDDGRANAIGRAFCAEMEARLDTVEAEGVHALILRGRPGFFSGGLDLKELPDLSPAALSDMTGRFMALMHRLFLFPKPIVAAADGHAIAGGMMLYLCADTRLAVDTPGARFGLNEAVTGIPLLGGTAGICQWGIPPAHHTELILHGRLIDARGTAERGITDELVSSPDELHAQAEARALALVDVSLPAYRLNKRILREPAWDAAVAKAGELADQASVENPFARIRR